MDVGIYSGKIYKSRSQLPAKQRFIPRPGLKSIHTLSVNDLEKPK